MISLRKEIQVAEHFAPRFQALVKAFLGLTSALPEAALPANPTLSGECRDQIDQSVAPLKVDDAPIRSIEQAGDAALTVLGRIRASNQSALEERDRALKDVIKTVADVTSSFRGHGERHKSNISKLADGFDELSRVENVNDLRRRLQDNAAQLRACAEEMRRESEESVQRFETQISAFQQRVDSARNDSSNDRLTGLPGRREAERHLQKVASSSEPVCALLFSIEGFKKINEKHGPLFGDKLLRAFAHLLSERYQSGDVPYRWGGHEFLVVAGASLAHNRDKGNYICNTFAASEYYTAEGGPGLPLRATVAMGIAATTRGDNMDALSRRLQTSLDAARGALWK